MVELEFEVSVSVLYLLYNRFCVEGWDWKDEINVVFVFGRFLVT